MAYIEYVRVDPGLEFTLEKLGNSLDFTSGDLASNRSGRLSSRQAVRLLQTSLLQPGALILIGLLVSLAIRITWVLFVSGQPPLSALLETLSKTLLLDFFGEGTPQWVGTLVLIPLAYAIYHVRHGALIELFDLLRVGVREVEGTLTRETKDRVVKTRFSKQVETFAVYYFVVDGRFFPVNRAAYDDLTLGLKYRLYYAPFSRRVLSAEPLPRDPQSAPLPETVVPPVAVPLASKTAGA